MKTLSFLALPCAALLSLPPVWGEILVKFDFGSVDRGGLQEVNSPSTYNLPFEAVDWSDSIQDPSAIRVRGQIKRSDASSSALVGWGAAMNSSNYASFTVSALPGHRLNLTSFAFSTYLGPYSYNRGTSFVWAYRIDENRDGIFEQDWTYGTQYSEATHGATVYDIDGRFLNWALSGVSTAGTIEFALFGTASIENGTVFAFQSRVGLELNGTVTKLDGSAPDPVPALPPGILGRYQHTVTYYLPDGEPAGYSYDQVRGKIGAPEASGVTYSRDTDTLFMVGDEGYAMAQFTKQGQFVNSMLFDYKASPRDNRALDDPEGISYLGNNTFAIADERDNKVRITTFDPAAMRTLANLNPTSYAFGPLANNNDLEGVAFDPINKSIWGLKEQGVARIYEMRGVPGVSAPGTAFSVVQPIARKWLTRAELYEGENGLEPQISDIFILAASNYLPPTHPSYGNLLILGRDAEKIVEITRQGRLVSTLDISMIGRQSIEGMTMDDDGVIYLVSEGNLQSGSPDNLRLSGLHVFRPREYKPISTYTSAATYYFEGRLNLAEASGVTYNWDTNSLFVVEDEGNAVIQIDKLGRVLNAMALQGGSRPQRALDDPEGITYMGNGEFMFADERDNVGRIGTYDPAATRTQAELAATAYAFGPATGNTGLEGVASDPLTDSVWGVQENPFKLYNLTFGTTPVVSEPLSAKLAEIAQDHGVTSLSDVYVLASSEAYTGSDGILLLARDQKLVLEIDRQGEVVSVLDISGLGRTKIEGMTMDDDGALYLVSEREESGTSIHDSRGALHVLTPAKHAVVGNGRGRATLSGTAGDDEIYGNPASDTLVGGAGKDTFVFKTLRDGPDTITDFTPGVDKIDLGELLDSLGYTGLDSLQDALQDGTVRVVASGTATVVQVRSSGSYRAVAQLSGVSLVQANKSENFLFKTHKLSAPAVR
jgi:uncharacterized protein YjiK